MAVRARGSYRGATLVAAVLAGAALAASSRLIADESPAVAKDIYITRIFVANSDGSDAKKLTDLPDYKAQGSPEWSRDGKRIAFDGYRPRPGATARNCDIVVVNADGSNPRVLLDGAMPSFSPGGTRIAFSRYSPNAGVWVMSSEGPDKELVRIDENGWGTDWAADGRLAYTLQTAGGDNLVILDLVEGRREYLFDEQNTPYSQIFWNFTWSPDCKRIVFKATTKEGKLEVGIVDVRGEKFGLVHRYQGMVLANFAWSPDGMRILMTKACPERNNLNQLFFVDPNTNEPPQLLSAQATDRSHPDVCFSPDGKKIAVSDTMLKPLVNPKTTAPAK